MESIYWVLSWICHRSCPHCYDARFRPYRAEDAARQLAAAEAVQPQIVANLPQSMRYLDGDRLHTGRIILAGGEVLLDGVRERLLYPALERLNEKYGGEVRLILQTTGDTIEEHHVAELLERHVWMISVSGIDEHHQGLEDEHARSALVARLTAMFERAGLKPHDTAAPLQAAPSAGGPFYLFFGATRGSWIGKLWPRGRTMENELSQADLEANFCGGWSGGKNFLRYGQAGSEVSIEPEGNVYPCCIKTRAPVGNVADESLEAILGRLRGNPVYEAISRGQPDEMGLAHGWTRERFRAESRQTLASGRVLENLCVGCDRFHDEVLTPTLVRLRAR